jgi:DNA topoisomerase I
MNNKEQDLVEELEDILLPVDGMEAAQAAGLYYVMGGEPGYTRKRNGHGFVYLDWKDRPVTSTNQLARIKALVIPPAWTNVWICRHKNGHIQATGRDKKGRKQYRYHAEWNAIRSQTKFSRMVAFGEALPTIRAQVHNDLRRQKMTHQKVIALVLRLLDRTLIRVGNQEYARANRSYGLTTLLDDHITVAGSRIMLDFIGKRGKHFEVDLHDRRLSALVKRCQDLPGQRLFQYVDEMGQCCQAVTSGDVNTYLRQAAGQDFTAKDFRTWGGTVLAAFELYQLGPAEDEKQADKNIVGVIKTVSDVLGNTPAICRKYYVHPAVLDAYRDSSLFEELGTALQQAREPAEAGLTVDEQAVLQLLRSTTDTVRLQNKNGAA